MSTTRAGTVYTRDKMNQDNFEEEEVSQTTEGMRTTLPLAVDGVAAVMQMLVEERRQREREQKEERRRREIEQEEERMKWKLEMRIRDEEMARREEYNQRQMEILHSLVQGVQLQGEAATRRAEGEKDVKVPKLTEQDDIVAYLTAFERLMVAYEVKRERWVFKLASNLVGKAQQAYTGLSAADAGSYDKLKEAILQRYDITEESYRQRFRTMKKKTGESSRELVAKLDDLASKWLKSCTKPEDVIDRIVLEQFLQLQTEEIRVFIQERKPKTSEEAGRLADDFLQARRENSGEGDRRSQDSKKNSVRFCQRCGIPGHLTKDCRAKLGRYEGHKEKSARPKHEVECFNCHKKGHYSSNCPHRALFCTERRMNFDGQDSVVKCPVRAQPGVVKSGIVEGHAVDNILLDTGCSRTLVHRKLVPEGKLEDAAVVAIRCAHGDTVLYPLATVSIEVAGRLMEQEAAVSDTLPVSVLLGTDTPELSELLWMDDEGSKVDEAFAVTTRASERRQKEIEDTRRKKGVCEAKVNGIDEKDRGNWMHDFEGNVVEYQREKTKKSRKQKRAERKRRTDLQSLVEQDSGTDDVMKEQGSEIMDKHALDISSEELKKMQVTDSTLEEIRSLVKLDSPRNMGFFDRDGLLFRRWTPQQYRREGIAGEGVEIEQLILPKQCRSKVMELAHSIPLAGHLGKKKDY